MPRFAKNTSLSIGARTASVPALIFALASFASPLARACAGESHCPARTAPIAPVAPSDSLFDDYSPTSPHWSHITTMMTDFYYSWTPAERTWAGRHYDYAMSGSASAWKASNPKVQHYRYVLLQATIAPKPGAKGDLQSAWFPDMLQWYARHQYRLETALLHQAGQPADSAHRLKPWGWDSFTWIINPADAGLVAYSEDRFRRAAEGEDGIFIDSQGSGDLMKNIKGSAEYAADVKWPPPPGPYNIAYAKLLARLKITLGSKTLMINSGPYRFAPDSANVTATSSTHMEKTNNPMSTDLPATWAWIDKLLARGAFVDFVSALDYADMPAVVKKGYAENIQSAYHSSKLAELASYYMVVPRSPNRLALQLVNMWDRPYSSIWLRAQEANIGHPTEIRQPMTSGIATSDSAGQKVMLFERNFDRALVLFRAQTGWGAQTYGPTTAVTIQLPEGESWLPLLADGTLDSPVTSVSLENAQGAILIKGGSLR